MCFFRGGGEHDLDLRLFGGGEERLLFSVGDLDLPMVGVSGDLSLLFCGDEDRESEALGLSCDEDLVLDLELLSGEERDRDLDLEARTAIFSSVCRKERATCCSCFIFSFVLSSSRDTNSIRCKCLIKKQSVFVQKHSKNYLVVECLCKIKQLPLLKKLLRAHKSVVSALVTIWQAQIFIIRQAHFLGRRRTGDTFLFVVAESSSW